MIDGPSEFFQNQFDSFVLPSHGKIPEIKFIFYSFREPESPQYITNANFSEWDIEKSGFDATSQTVFIIHGFREIGTLWPKKISKIIAGYGLPNSIGHFDFYVNGGKFQPGCKSIAEHLFDWNVAAIDSTMRFMLGIIDEKGMVDLGTFFSCGHSRACEVFIESIENEACEFWAVECSSWERYLSGQCDDHDTVVMGYHADGFKTLVKDLPERKFFLKTKGYSPYCLL
ncbi:lipase domain-containing protein [Nephila pilipes]|uniref:Lipase domain-containing protein n=1 Tax=Nephila pilipes TaxID=299642 RepID=A0A8X6P9S6_NEPPI|nr:lipase domain-containing protein [Nephila pilipes]GFT55933.1 lipase domain-containing protein [Nephila pilipes]